MITAMEMIMPSVTLSQAGICRPSFPEATNAKRTMKTRMITTDTARKGMRLVIMLTAEANVTVTRAMTNETIALTCRFSSPRILDFSRIAKTTAKTSKKGRMRSLNKLDERIVSFAMIIQQLRRVQATRFCSLQRRRRLLL